MSDQQEILKLRIMTSFLSPTEGQCTVTGISLALREEKWKISKIMTAMEQEGLLDKSNPRAPMLTERGLAEARRLEEGVEVAQNHLIYEGMELETARRDAYMWALHGSDALMDVIRESDTRYRLKRELRNQKNFRGSELCRHLSDGCYQFPFIIYREHVKDGKNISMANDGFAHPCTLYVDGGTGTVQLLIQSTEQRSGSNGKIMHGKVDQMAYFDSGRFIGAEFTSDVVSFPIDALNFVNIGSGTGNVLHGSVCLKMRCSCGIIHMPESKAIFTILI